MATSKNWGFILAYLCYIMWGLTPIYFKQISDIPYLEIVSHRIIWSFVLLIIIIHLSNKWHLILPLLLRPKIHITFVVTAFLLVSNWLIFIWAVANNYLIDASMGSFITPLFNVSLAMIFFKEKLRSLQWIAVIIAGAGIIIQLISFGSVPWVALISCITWGFYGLLRKKLDVDAQVGMIIEMMILSPFAFYLLFFTHSISGALFHNSGYLNLLLMSAGIVTTLPLICYNIAARVVKFTTLGFIQYISPSLSFMLAIVLYNEKLTTDKLITFLFVWAALILFMIDALQARKIKKSSNIRLSNS